MTAVIVSRNDGLSRRGGERLAGVGANPLDHGAQSVGALRRQMLAKSEFVERGDGVGAEDLLGRGAGVQRQQDRYQPPHDVGVAVAEIFQQGFVAPAAVDLPGKPDLAGAALHLVGGGMLGFGHRIEHASEFDDVPVAVVPILQQLKIIPDFVDRHWFPRSIPKPYIGSRGNESDIAARNWPSFRALFGVTASAWRATPPPDRPGSACRAARPPRARGLHFRRRRSSRYGRTPSCR